MVPDLRHLKLIECESCPLGKHRSPFASRINKKSLSPFSLVHSDVWGSSRVILKLGRRYFVTFMDDYSKLTWIYLMNIVNNVLSFRVFMLR